MVTASNRRHAFFTLRFYHAAILDRRRTCAYRRSGMAKAGGGEATILVADDDPSILGMLRARLSAVGYRVVTAGDGGDALEVARREKPALVVLDVMMPTMTGWEVCRELRADPATAAVKIIMLTAIGSAMNEMTSPLYGADAYLDKPFEFTDLEAQIAKQLTA
jgi:DNA-binding response OmpR family regulator